MSGILSHSPARIVQQLLIDLDLCTYPASNQAWPVAWGNLPDTPDNAVGILDTAGITQGRDNESGELVEFQAFQIKVRSLDIGYQQSKLISHTLDTEVLNRRVTVVDGTTNVYEIAGITRITDPIDIGPDPVSRRREFTINARLSVKQLS